MVETDSVISEIKSEENLKTEEKKEEAKEQEKTEAETAPVSLKETK